MKSFFTLLLVSGVIFFSSCGNGSNDPLPVAPIADSSTNGSYLRVWFLANNFLLTDLKLNGIPSITLHGYDTYNATDSIWECHIQVVDGPKERAALDITAVGSSPTGDFKVVKNSSTLIDYSQGENKTYAISLGSIINITNAAYPLKGSMALTLYYNKQTTYANDSFKIN